MGRITYKIIKEKGLLIQKFSGEITKNQLVSFFKELFSNPDYHSVSSTFSDFTGAIVALSDRDVFKIAKFVMSHAPKVQYIRNSIWVTGPLETAFSVLYEEIMKMPLYSCKVFSTFKGAANYIKYEASDLANIIEMQVS